MSREIDALVWEHVFGAEWSEETERGWRMLQLWDVDRTSYRIVATRNPDGELPERGYGYSTDWRASGEVVEKMRSEAVFIDIEPRSDRYDATAGWQGDDGEDIWRQAFVTGAAGPEVVCKAALAALRAKGVEVPK